MIRAFVSLLLVTASAGISVAGASPPGHILFRFADPRITEASGIAVGITSPGVFYVENDSGDTNRFFAVDRRSGETVATIVVAGARNVDWEDLAVADDPQGTPSVWLADIGDNDAVRRTVQLYQVAEPHIDPAGRGRAVQVPVEHEWRLRYPGGPVDAESLAVSPDGTPYIVTKAFGSASVYRVPGWRPGGAVQMLRPVGRISFHSTGTANPFGLLGQLTATGAAMSSGGAVFAVRTYSDVWAWRSAGSLADTLRQKPIVVPLPQQPQGEGVALVGKRAIVDSEHPHSAVYAVPLPNELFGRPAPTPPRTRPVAPNRPADSQAGTRWWWIVAGLGVAAALVAGLLVAARRRR